MGKIPPLKKQLGIADYKPIEANISSQQDADEDKDAKKSTPTSSVPSSHVENDWEETGNEFTKNVKIEVFISILENVLESEGVKLTQRKIIVSKVQARLNSVMQDE